MTNQSDERLSYLVDDELDETQRRHAIAALENDPDLRHRWERYHLMRDALGNNLPDAIDPQFSARVMQALEDEPTVLAPPPPRQNVPQVPHFRKRVTGFAVAASVAAVAVLGVQILYRDDPAAPAAQQVAKTAAPAVRNEFARVAKQTTPPVGTLPAAANVRVVTAHPQALQYFDPRLHKYLINHSQQAARGGIQGVMPYARIVAHPGPQRNPAQQ